MRVSFHLREATAWAKQGFEVAWKQMSVPFEVPPAPMLDLAKIPEFKVEGRRGRMVVTGSGFEAVLDTQDGGMSSLVLGDHILIGGDGEAVPGPVLNVFRAPVNNDKYCSGGWTRTGLDDLLREMGDIQAFVFPNTPHESRAIELQTAELYHGREGCSFEVETTWTILGNGWIDVSVQVVPTGAPAILPRMGLTMSFPKELDSLTWYGRGQHENYVDRKRSADVGVHRSSVAEQFVPYVDTQDTGSRSDVRWALLTDEAGAGVMIVPSTPLSFSALHHTAQELAAARHPVDLVPRDDVVVCLDAAQTGLGGASCGPPPLSQYVLSPRPIRFSFGLRPHDPSMGSPAKVARMLPPVAPPIAVTRDEEGIVTMACPHPHVRIEYQVVLGEEKSGWRPYTGPFPLPGGGQISYHAKGAGMIEDLPAFAHFDVLIPRADWRVVSFDSEHPGEGEAYKAIDGDPQTYWHTKWGNREPKHPHELVVDLGATYELRAVEHLPRQSQANGRIKEYEIFLSYDGETWLEPEATGEFENSPKRQKVSFDEPLPARFVRLVALSEVLGNPWTSIAELDVVATRRLD